MHYFIFYFYTAEKEVIFPERSDEDIQSELLDKRNRLKVEKKFASTQGL